MIIRVETESNGNISGMVSSYADAVQFLLGLNASGLKCVRWEIDSMGSNKNRANNHFYC